MACDKIMLIRHAERPDRARDSRGVSLDGRKDEESLSVRGWQRAGALARFFAPREGCFGHPALARPNALYACKATPNDPSLRPQHTLAPLAELLGVELDRHYLHGDEAALVERVVATEGPALIAWKHDAMHVIANAIVGNSTTAPQRWPYDCYDIVWVFDRLAVGWSFAQIPQRLLAGDRADPIG